jgi:two-component system, sensor histidine kinase and response regulator
MQAQCILQGRFALMLQTNSGATLDVGVNKTADTSGHDASQADVTASLLRMAFARLRLSVLMTFAVVFVFVGLLWPFFPADLMFDWGTVLVLVAAARYAMWSAFTRATAESQTRHYWRWMFTMTAILAGASWSFGPITLMPEPGHTESMLLCLTLLAVTAVSMVALTMQPPAMYGFQVAALFPTAAALFATNGAVEQIGAAIVVAATIVLMIVGRGSGVSTRSLLETEWRLSRAIAATEDARSRAEAASAAKSQFLATMSHEIRTPMNGVLGMTELLLTSTLDAAQRQWTQAVHSSGQHLLGVLNDILDYSKIESGKLELEAVDFNLVDVVEEATAMFVRPAEAKGLELACQFSPPTASFMFRGDPFRLRQVIANLISNAVKFTDQGEVVIRVYLLDQTANSAALRISVQDTGSGIAPESIDRIFEHFSQADESTTRQFGGTGLGLAICRRLLDLMGGEVIVESALGIGSNFIVDLTLTLATISPVRTDHSSFAGVRTLVVDDNAVNREILQHQLQAWGMAVHCVESGQQALLAMSSAAAEGHPFELGILDLHMPVMDGLTLAQTIQKDPSLASTALVMLSSTYIHADEVIRSAAGLRRYLNKPVRQSDLHSALHSALAASDSVPPTASKKKQEGNAGITETLRGHVLLVEDNDINQALAVAMLAKLGLTWSIAENGLQAVEQVRLGHFDVVLMDCQMPVLDGYQATAAIRALPGQLFRNLPIIALTANAMPGDEQLCMDSGMNDFLAKPFTLDSLRTTITRWLTITERLPAEPQPSSTHSQTVQLDLAADIAQINEKAIKTLLDLDPNGSPALLHRLIGSFLKSVDVQMDRLSAASSSGDLDQMRQVAHAWKSSAANLGADTLAACLKELEEHARGNQLTAAQALVEPTRRAQAGTVQALRRVLERQDAQQS